MRLALASFGQLLHRAGSGQKGKMTEPIPRYEERQALQAVKVGIIFGFVACLAYPLAVLAHLPKSATLTLVACFGPALSFASFGLRRLLDWKRPTISSSLGLMLNALGGALFSAMAFVQLAVGYPAGADKVPSQFVAVWLGLDVAWDAYIGIGTVCFAVAMLRHPRFGVMFTVFGVGIGAGLLALHLYTFPTPPQNAGLIDLGLAFGLWYFVVTIQMWRSLRWASQHTPAA
jgi:hypothetical protein